MTGLVSLYTLHNGGVGETGKGVRGPLNLSSYHKPFNTLLTLLVNLKDKTEKSKQCGVVYTLLCEQYNGEKHIGEKGPDSRRHV